MAPVVSGDSGSAIGRKGRNATDRVARELIGMLGPGVSKSEVAFGWPEKSGGAMGTDASHGYVVFGLSCGVTAESSSPKVLELETNELVGDVVVFRPAEASARMTEFFNGVVDGKPLQVKGTGEAHQLGAECRHCQT